MKYKVGQLVRVTVNQISPLHAIGEITDVGRNLRGENFYFVYNGWFPEHKVFPINHSGVPRASCKDSSNPMIDETSIAYKTLSEETKLLMEEGVINEKGNPEYHSEIFEEVLFEAFKDKLVVKAKARKAEREKAEK